MIDWHIILTKEGKKSPYELLHELYVVKGMSLNSIAEHIDSVVGRHCITHQTVRNYLVRFGIQLRSRGGDNSSKEVEIPLDEFQQSTYQQLSKKYKVCVSTVRKYTARHRQGRKERVPTPSSSDDKSPGTHS